MITLIGAGSLILYTTNTHTHIRYMRLALSALHPIHYGSSSEKPGRHTPYPFPQQQQQQQHNFRYTPTGHRIGLPPLLGLFSFVQPTYFRGCWVMAIIFWLAFLVLQWTDGRMVSGV